MATISAENLPKLLRTRYRTYLRYQGNLKSVLLQRLQRRTENYVEGDKISIPLHSSGGGGHAYNSSGKTPPGDVQGVERQEHNYKEMLQTLKIRVAMRKRSRGAGAERGALEFEIDSLAKQRRHDRNVDLHGDGSGLLCNIVSASSSTAFVVDNARVLRNGLRVSVLLKASGSPGSGGIASARINVNANTKTVTLIGATLVDGAGTELNANATLYGVYRQQSFNDCPWGLKAWVSDTNPSGGNIGGIDRTLAANAFFQSVVHANGGTPRPLTYRLIQDLLDDIDLQSESDGVSLLMCGHRVWARFMDVLTADKRFGGKETLLNGWAKAIEFPDIPPLVRDKHCPPDTMYALAEDTFTIFQSDEGDWIDRGGTILFPVPGEASDYATWQQMWNLVCWSPCSNGKLTDLEYSDAA